ncbi:MAG TPA: ABC transporter permease [Mycobacteriales bacterium]|nr:ABC transporter permease [Mycobacteriales bacterium]
MSGTTGTVMISEGEESRTRRGPIEALKAAKSTVIESTWGHRTLVGNFARRELKAKYKGSILGWAWSMVNPLATLGVYTLAFSFILRVKPPLAGNGDFSNFAIYLFTGLVGWNLFFGLVNGTMGALIGAGALLRKVYFPPSAPIFGSALAALNQTAIEFGLLIIAYAALQNISWVVVLVPVYLILLFIFSLGLGMALSVVNARYRDVAYLVTVFLQLMFYAIPVIYPLSVVQALYKFHPWMRIYEWNPLVQFIEAFRDTLYLLKTPDWSWLGYLVAVSFGMLALGWWIFERSAREVAEEL